MEKLRDRDPHALLIIIGNLTYFSIYVYDDVKL